MNKKALNEDALAAVTGGIDKIVVDIKTLSGENDPYFIAPSDTIDQLLEKYAADKRFSTD